MCETRPRHHRQKKHANTTRDHGVIGVWPSTTTTTFHTVVLLFSTVLGPDGRFAMRAIFKRVLLSILIEGWRCEIGTYSCQEMSRLVSRVSNNGRCVPDRVVCWCAPPVIDSFALQSLHYIGSRLGLDQSTISQVIHQPHKYAHPHPQFIFIAVNMDLP